MTYLLTFRCYGTHLPGDARGWVDRTRGDHRGGARAPNAGLERYARSLLRDEPNWIDRDAAAIVLAAIREVCAFRGWQLVAAHVRSTHVHCVVGGVDQPNRAIADFKAYSSRQLNLVEERRLRWAREGSTRRLLTCAAVDAAVRYVVQGQGEPMAMFAGASPG